MAQTPNQKAYARKKKNVGIKKLRAQWAVSKRRQRATLGEKDVARLAQAQQTIKEISERMTTAVAAATR